MLEQSFRPLAGVNYNMLKLFVVGVELCFRPLAGVNYNLKGIVADLNGMGCSFRPLAGVNYNYVEFVCSWCRVLWVSVPLRG